jgi:hypothetical protein
MYVFMQRVSATDPVCCVDDLAEAAVDIGSPFYENRSFRGRLGGSFNDSGGEDG